MLKYNNLPISNLNPLKFIGQILSSFHTNATCRNLKTYVALDYIYLKETFESEFILMRKGKETCQCVPAL